MTIIRKNHNCSLSQNFLVSAVTTFCLIAFFATGIGPFRSSRILSREVPMVATTTPACPIIVYNKQIKTGSTVIANVLYRSTEAYGCFNAGCKLQQALMLGNASNIGARNGLTLSCHAQEKNKNIVPNLRATHGKDFIYIASVREPMGWFKSAACFFYRQRVNRTVAYDDEGFKTVVDWLLQPTEYEQRELYLFQSLGLCPNSTKAQIKDKLIQYDLIIDNAKLSEGLEELGRLLGWKLLKPSAAKAVTYRGPLYDTYRANEIRQMTRRVAKLYEVATEIQKFKYERPAYARE